MMANVGLLTTQAVMNYGALLQAYALKTAIQSLGHDCEVVNYVPQSQSMSNPLSFFKARRHPFAKAVMALTHRREFSERRALIDAFRDTYVSSVPARSVAREGLSEVLDGYDVVCCGSDQLWNVAIPDMADGTYALNFPHEVPSVAYAVSLGDGPSVAAAASEALLPYIRRFSAVSVREEAGRVWLTSHDVESEVCVDPTMLVDASLWEGIATGRIHGGRYVFVYGFDSVTQSLSDLAPVARTCAEKLGLPVVNASMAPGLARAGFENMLVCGPREFLALVRDADLVVANSFHACVFSHVFGTPLVVAAAAGAGPDERKSSLLRAIGCGGRVLRPGDAPDAGWLLEPLPSETPVRAGRRASSWGFLGRALEGAASQ